MEDRSQSPVSSSEMKVRKTGYIRSLAGPVALLFFCVLIAILYISNPGTVFEPPFFLFALNTLFLGIIPFYIAYLSFATYQKNGALGLIFLGSGALVMGIGGIVTGIVIGLPNGTSASVAIYNTLFLAGAIFSVFASFAYLFPMVFGVWARGRIAAAYTTTASLALVFILATLVGVVPPYFAQGGGPTLLRQIVLVGAIWIFFLASIIFFLTGKERHEHFFEWYSYGLALVAIGLSAVLLQHSVGDPMGWAGRLAQYAGACFLLAGVFSLRVAARQENLSAEEMLARFFRESGQGFRMLVANAPDALVVFVNNRFAYANDAAVALYGGVSPADFAALPVEDLVPEEDRAALLDRIQKLVRNEQVPDREMRIVRRDGTVVPVSVKSAPVVYNGQPAIISILRDITQRKAIERERNQLLKMEQERAEELQKIMDTVPAAIWITRDPEARHIYGNRFSYDWLNLPVGSEASKSAPPGQRPGTFRLFKDGRELQPEEMPVQRSARGEILQNYEYTVVYPDNTVRDIAGNAVPLLDEEGTPCGSVSAFIDITERKRIDAMLRESEMRHRLLSETMLQGVVYQNADGTVISMNPAAEKILGKSPKEFLGSTSESAEYNTIREDGSIFPGAEHPAMVALRTGKQVRQTVMGVYNPREKKVRWISIDAVPLFRPGEDRPSQVYTVFQDITQQKNVEKALRESEKKYRNLFENTSDEVQFWHLVRDGSGTIKTWRLVDANPACLNRWGKTRAETIGKAADEIFPGTTKHFMPIITKIFADGTPHSWESYIPQLDQYLRMTSIPVGEFFIMTGGDITKIKKAEDELRKTLAEKEVLLSEIHHRVKNNLTAFISLLSLEGAYDDSPAGIAMKTDLQNRARSMALIHETLYRTREFSKVDMEVYLETLVHQIVNSFQSPRSIVVKVEAKGISLDLARSTPTGLIVNELVTNSLKYAFPPDTPTADGKPCTIGISLNKADGEFALRVRDNGIGLPAGFDITTSKTLGLKLVNFLARHQLRAKIDIAREAGTRYEFRFRDYAEQKGVEKL